MNKVMNNQPIGVFDSGLGGLNVLKELRKELPHEHFIYLGDTKRFPYGNKSSQAIIDIARDNVNFLLDQDVKMVIIACGTATSQALETLQKEFSVPIIGIIEPTVLNLKERIDDLDNSIGVIATKGTIRSGAWEKKISEIIPTAEIVCHPAPLLATMAEEGWINNEVAEYTVKEYMKLFKSVDKLILGCTHYPLIKDEIKEVLGNIKFFEGSYRLAIHLKEILEENNLINNTSQGTTMFIDSSNLKQKEKRFFEIINKNYLFL
jgi:glutamate racemase